MNQAILTFGNLVDRKRLVNHSITTTAYGFVSIFFIEESYLSVFLENHG